MRPLREQTPVKLWWLIAFSLFAAVFWAFYWWFMIWAIPYKACTDGSQIWAMRGQFGDMFGALTSLFTVLTFAFVIYTMLLQREANKTSAQLEAHTAILASIQQQIESARDQSKLTNTPADLETITILIREHRYYSEQLKGLLLDGKTEATIASATTRSGPHAPALSDEDIISAFSKIPWFVVTDLRKDIKGIRNRLESWGIDNGEKVKDLASNLEIRTILRRIFLEELLRPKEKPFDADALAVWGGALWTQGLRPGVEQHIRNQIRKSKEYLEKHPNTGSR